MALDSSALALARAASPSALSRASRSLSTSATTAAGVAGWCTGKTFRRREHIRSWGGAAEISASEDDSLWH